MSVGLEFIICSMDSSIISHSYSPIHGLTGVIIKDGILPDNFIKVFYIITHTWASLRCHSNSTFNMPVVNTLLTIDLFERGYTRCYTARPSVPVAHDIKTDCCYIKSSNWK